MMIGPTHAVTVFVLCSTVDVLVNRSSDTGRVGGTALFDILEVFAGDLSDDSQGRLDGDVTGEVHPVQKGARTRTPFPNSLLTSPPILLLLPIAMFSSRTQAMATLPLQLLLYMRRLCHREYALHQPEVAVSVPLGHEPYCICPRSHN